MKITSFHDLQVWQKAMQLTKNVYKLTEQIPPKEKYSLTSQITRSAVSIPSNIAEGSKRGSKKDYLKFLKVANGSAAELETQLLLIHDLYEIDVSEVTPLLKETQKMLETMIKKLSE